MTPGNFYTISLMKMKVKTVIKTFPSSLSHVGNDGRLPIHLAAFFIQSVPFVPLLVEEGVKFEVGGETNAADCWSRILFIHNFHS